MSNADEIRKLKELLDEGVITPEEFEIQKRKLIQDRQEVNAPQYYAEVPFRKKKKNRGCLIIVVVLLLAIGGFIALLSQLLPSPLKANDSRLTLEKYNKIQNGMTYDEVVEIIGFEGTPEYEVGEPGSEFHVSYVCYMGNDQVAGTLGAEASFMFHGGKLNMKSQMGLS